MEPFVVNLLRSWEVWIRGKQSSIVEFQVREAERISALAHVKGFRKQIICSMMYVDIVVVAVARIRRICHAQVHQAVVPDIDEDVRQLLCIFSVVEFWIPPDCPDVLCVER